MFACNDALTLDLFRGNVIRSFIAAEYEVHILAPYGPRISKLIVDGARYHRLRLSPQSMDWREEARSAWDLHEVYAKVRPMVIFQYTIKINIYGTIAAKRLGIPVVCMAPGLGRFVDLPSGIARGIVARGYRYAARHAREFWFLNEHDYGYFDGKGWLARQHVRLLPGEGVDLDHYRPRPLPTDRHTARIGFVGRLLDSKGIRVFVAAAKRARARGVDASFEVLGPLAEDHPGGISAEELREWCDEGAIRYHGTALDVRPFLYASDVIAMPFLAREGANRVIMESLACGRPVVTTPVPGGGELVEQNLSGYIVPCGDVDALVDVLQAHLEMTVAQRGIMGARARERAVRRYDERKVLQHYFDAVTQVQHDLHRR